MTRVQRTQRHTHSLQITPARISPHSRAASAKYAQRYARTQFNFCRVHRHAHTITPSQRHVRTRVSTAKLRRCERTWPRAKASAAPRKRDLVYCAEHGHIAVLLGITSLSALQVASSYRIDSYTWLAYFFLRAMGASRRARVSADQAATQAPGASGGRLPAEEATRRARDTWALTCASEMRNTQEWSILSTLRLRGRGQGRRGGCVHDTTGASRGGLGMFCLF